MRDGHNVPAVPLCGVLCRGRCIELGWPEEHEFDALTAMRNRPHVRARFLDPRPLDLVRNREWLRSGMRRPEEALLAIREIGTGALFGMIGWTHWDPEDRSIEVGRLVVDAAAVRRHLVRPRGYPGVGADAATTLRDYAFERMDIAHMRSTYIDGNVHSARVHRLGRGRVICRETVQRRDGSIVTLARLELSRDEWLAIKGAA